MFTQQTSMVAVDSSLGRMSLLSRRPLKSRQDALRTRFIENW